MVSVGPSQQMTAGQTRAEILVLDDDDDFFRVSITGSRSGDSSLGRYHRESLAVAPSWHL